MSWQRNVMAGKRPACPPFADVDVGFMSRYVRFTARHAGRRPGPTQDAVRAGSSRLPVARYRSWRGGGDPFPPRPRPLPL